MTKLNIHRLFYKDYFNTPKKTFKDNKVSFSFDKIDEVNTQIITSKFEENKARAEELVIIGSSNFILTTKYPGLLVGSGYDHETHSDDEFKLGFSFDFTTGLPIIPGSSIKGVLRSSFRKKVNNQPFGLVIALLAALGIKADEGKCFLLENELFGDSEDNAVSMIDRDIFHDAIIEPTHTGLFMANDFITPHRNRENPEMSPYTNPIPLQFLKIKPNVPIRFQFDLKKRDTQILTVEQRLKFYESIIRLLGVGAKTRVGYGKFKKG
jgi:CRISPR-associated protein Cmr6